MDQNITCNVYWQDFLGDQNDHHLVSSIPINDTWLKAFHSENGIYSNSVPRWKQIRLEQLPRDDQMSNFFLDGHHSNDLYACHRWQAAYLNTNHKTFFGYRFPYKLKGTFLVYYDKISEKAWKMLDNRHQNI